MDQPKRPRPSDLQLAWWDLMDITIGPLMRAFRRGYRMAKEDVQRDRDYAEQRRLRGLQ